jgi:hypothetical protein
MRVGAGMVEARSGRGRIVDRYSLDGARWRSTPPPPAGGLANR